MKHKAIIIYGFGVAVLMILMALVPTCSAGINRDRYAALGMEDAYTDEQWKENDEPEPKTEPPVMDGPCFPDMDGDNQPDLFI